tara:strand:- start:517 stop:681 length:165 start_codon:yes stop_codon:yes gene_type:complete
MQEWSTMLPMNEEAGHNEGWASYDTDYYFCNDCDEDCSPIRSEINSLHKDYEKE